MRIISPEEFPVPWFKLLPRQKRGPGNPGTRGQYEYKDLITAFDIETTRLREFDDNTVMYIWMWSFGNEYLVIGRTWEQFEELMDVIQVSLQDGERLVVWVHNLSYEFSFLRGIHRFKASDVFAIKSRKILNCKWGAVEFKCSYLHSNMSLSEYTSRMKVEHQKLSGVEFDYSKRRLPWTPMTERELQYCYNDVLGLIEAITVDMKAEGDNIYTFPATSTGYVRRDAKAAMRLFNWQSLHDMLPDMRIYTMLREAFRGGDVHANRYFAGQIVRNGHSADRSSSYPDIQCNELFPMSAFALMEDPKDIDAMVDLIERRGRAALMRCAITALRLKESTWPVPYLSRDKCRNILNGKWDNGRILEADYLETTITDVDLRILMKEYEWDDIVFTDVAHARYGRLPRPLIDVTIDYYRKKTALKGVDGQEIFYTKNKNKLNSIYGMMAQNPCRRSLLYTQDGVIDEWGQVDFYPEDGRKTDEELLEQANRRAFLSYAWGCWVTVWARYRLHEGIWTVIEQGGEFIYCDTDSVKYIGEVDWTAYNSARIAASSESGAWADDPAGNRHYMGVFEQEHDWTQFSTLGAKKYVYTELGRDGREKLISTIAGVGKTLGAKELLEAGGIAAFKPGFVFREAGGLEAVYNDEVDELVEIDGHQLRITPNVTLRESSYTLGLAGDYERLLRNYQSDIDF